MILSLIPGFARRALAGLIEAELQNVTWDKVASEIKALCGDQVAAELQKLIGDKLAALKADVMARLRKLLKV